MIFFLTNIFLAVSLAVDAFVVSMAIATKHHKNISVKWFIFIPLLFGALQGIMPLLGWLITDGLYEYIEQYDHWIAFILLAVIGMNMIRNAGRDVDDNPKASFKLIPIFGLGIATSIDALAIGFTLNTITTAPIYTIIYIFFVTTILCYVAFFAARKIPQSIANPSEFFAGIVLIIMGVKTLLTHLF